jgi:hypothetical protein
MTIQIGGNYADLDYGDEYSQTGFIKYYNRQRGLKTGVL